MLVNACSPSTRVLFHVIMPGEELSSLIGGLEGTSVRLGLERVEPTGPRKFEVTVIRGFAPPPPAVKPAITSTNTSDKQPGFQSKVGTCGMSRFFFLCAKWFTIGS